MWLGLLFLVLATVAPAQAQVLFEESFEDGFEGSGWVWTDGWGDGAWAVVGAPVRTGAGSLQLTGAFGNIYLSRDFGAPMTDSVLEVWFYDGLETTKETFVSVSSSAEYLTTSSVHLKVGTTCAYSGARYSVAEGWHLYGYVVGPPRTPGWHQVRIENAGGVNRCFLDGVLIHTTAFQGDWRYLILNEDSHCLTGGSWFDDIRVYRTEPVGAALSSWGSIKALY